MTQRVWTIALACGLSTGLLWGCTPFRPRHEETLIAYDPDKPPPDPPGDSPYAVVSEGGGSSKRAPDHPEDIRRQGYTGEGSLQVTPVPYDPTKPNRNTPDLLQPMFPRAADGGASPPDEPVLLALRCLLEKRPPEDAVRALEHYDKPSQEALLLLLPWVARFAEGGLNQAKPKDIAIFLDQLEELARRLRPRADLTLGKVCFCRDVRGFGMIDALPADHAFLAGNGGRFGEPIVLYVEVGNTASRPVGARFETRIAGGLEILDAQGKRCWGQLFAAEPNISVSPRHDYFIIFRLAVPADLPPGHYTLVVQLTDQTWHGSSKETPRHRTVEQKRGFDVVSPDTARGPVRTTTLIVPAGSSR
jgi:hypothetical protein